MSLPEPSELLEPDDSLIGLQRCRVDRWDLEEPATLLVFFTGSMYASNRGFGRLDVDEDVNRVRITVWTGVAAGTTVLPAAGWLCATRVELAEALEQRQLVDGATESET